MNFRLAKRFLLPLALLLTVKTSVLGCATCYGASDSPLAQGMNWGIVTLLGVIGSVLAGVVAFFVHVGIKSSKLDTGKVIKPEQKP